MKALLVPVTNIGEPPVPFWIGDVPTLAARTHDWYLQESYGRVALDFTITPPLAFEFGPFFSWDIVPAVATIGFDSTTYDRVIYLLSNTNVTGYKGLNWGRSSSVNCMGSDYEYFAIIHELGHSFGLAHPLALTIGTMVGNVLTLPPLDVITGGQTQYLYDPSTSMGYAANFATFNGPQECEIGWITPTVYSGGDQTITLTALGVPGGAQYVVKIPCTAWRATSARVYWLEYRIDTIGNNGIELHTLGDFGCFTYAHVDTSFGVGQSFTDGTITVDVLAMDATTATIRLRDTPAVVVPPTVDPRITQALASLQSVRDSVNQWRQVMPTQADVNTALAAIDAARTAVAALAPNTPPITPASTDSPDRTLCPPAASITVGGHVWTLGPTWHGSGGYPVLQDSNSAAGGEAVLITNVAGQIWVKNALGDWYRWTGTSWPLPTRVAP